MLYIIPAVSFVAFAGLEYLICAKSKNSSTQKLMFFLPFLIFVGALVVYGSEAGGFMDMRGLATVVITIYGVLCLVAILMLITAASWIEPLVLLAASGVAVLLNMGSNIIFGEISYITKAVAAILQLALSIDYSIVLLHSYRAIKEKEEDNDKAMLLAIKEVVRDRKSVV